MKDSEANIQAEFYHRARLLGLEVQMEMHTPVGRLDAAILSSDRSHLLAIVECKRYKISRDAVQIKRYERIGVPVYILSSKYGAETLAKSLKLAFSDDASGVSIEKVMSMPKCPKKARYSRMLEFTPSGRLHIKW
jgi:hypothetical protein